MDASFLARMEQLLALYAPAGRARWTLRLLADKAVELELCESLSHTRARSILKKTVSLRT